MDRPKRAIKATVRLINDPNFGLRNQKKEVAEPVNKRQPKKQPQQPAEQRKVSEGIASKTPSAPAKTKKREGRTLNLDLPKKPPSNDRKCTEDWNLPDHPFWKDSFIHRKTTPHRNIWRRQKN